MACGMRRPVGIAMQSALFCCVLLVAACAQTASVAAPSAPNGAAARTWQAEPRSLVLERGDLPAGFEVAADQTEGPKSLIVYLRPAALDPRISGGNPLLGVIAGIAVYTTTAEAEGAWADMAANTNAQIVGEIAELGAGAADIKAAAWPGAVQNATASDAYRVTYTLVGVPVYEYRYRFRLGNVVASLTVSAAGTQAGASEEPPSLAEDARALAQRQIDRIVAAP